MSYQDICDCVNCDNCKKEALKKIDNSEAFILLTYRVDYNSNCILSDNIFKNMDKETTIELLEHAINDLKNHIAQENSFQNYSSPSFLM